MLKNDLGGLIGFLNAIKPHAKAEAERLFPDHPKAREIWIKLCSGNGGIDQVVEVLGLHRKYDAYSMYFNENVNKGRYELAGLAVEDFCSFCKEQLRENFYLFK